MRNRETVFITKLTDYLRGFFTQKAAELQIDDIVLWQDGYAGVISGLTHYPGCIVIVDERELPDAYTARYRVVVYVGVTSGDPQELETLGRTWQDILEDAIRDDWSLGGTCLRVLDNARIRPGWTEDIYTAGLEFTCEVDVGGYVYEQE